MTVKKGAEMIKQFLAKRKLKKEMRAEADAEFLMEAIASDSSSDWTHRQHKIYNDFMKDL